MSNTFTVSGRVVAQPEVKQPREGLTILEFPLYDNEQRKDRQTGDYVDTGNTLKLRVSLFNDMADEWADEISKGDVLKIECSITEVEYDKKDGTTGRSLQTTFVNSIEHIYKVESQGGSGGGWGDDSDGSGW